MRHTRLIVTICAVLAVQSVYAAVPVVESQGSQSGPVTPGGPTGRPANDSAVRSYGAQETEVAATSSPATSSPPSATVGNSGASSMFQQFQQFESDVAELRGIVEEQSHLIETLQREQKEQYIDLDRRLTLLMQGQAAAAAPVTPGGGNGSGATTPSSSGNPERDAYTAAFNLTKSKRYTDAIAAFDQMLVTYPNGEFSGNAYYWLGELYLALPEPALEKSRQSFSQVVNKYPTNPKISDAMYKLGVVYHRLGDRAKAMEYLTRVQSQYPGTAAAKLAQSYAAELR